MIQIGIVEDNRILGQDLKAKIELNSDMKVQFICCNGQEILDYLHVNPLPDVLFMDIEMPIMNGLIATQKIREKHTEIPIIMCSIYDDEESILTSITSGSTGYILKEESPEFVHQAIFQALQGGSPLNPFIAKKTLRFLQKPERKKTSMEIYGLTPREIEVLELLAKGKSYDETAALLSISTGTIRKHIENLYRKLNVTNKIDAIRILDGQK